MARMYDMETVNVAMQEAMALVTGPGVRLTSRERLILNTFAAMKPVEAERVVHGTWETSVMYDGDGNKVFRHVHRGCGFGCSSYKERGTPYCPNCGAIMDGRVEE